MTKRQRDTLIRRIEYEKKVIAEARDNLRELLSDATAVIDSSDEALEDLDRAVDTLSKYL